MSKYQPSSIEKKWQEKWREAGLYRVDLDKGTEGTESTKGKYYLLVELPYPSGDLHMGHWFTFAVTDILGRMKRMQGYNVFFPVGFDAFGLPAENAAIKRGINPREWTYSNIEAMKMQFATMGGMHDFEHGVITCDPEYYRWNQWIFTKMFEKGLAYRGKILSNWCPKDQTVLANENVEAGKCWRCGTEVVQKEVDQWMLKITAYAERLLWPETRGPVSSFLPASARSREKSKLDGQDNVELRAGGNPSTTATPRSKAFDTFATSDFAQQNLSTPDTLKLDWPQAIRDGQNNWIGKSEGIEIDFPLDQKFNFVLLHGFTGSPEANFFPWLKKVLEDRGYRVQVPVLPDSDDADPNEQIKYVLENCEFDENTVLLGHSLGTVVAMKAAEKLETKLAGLVLVAAFVDPDFKDKRRPFEDRFDWKFDAKKIKGNSGFIKVIGDPDDSAVTWKQIEKVVNLTDGELIKTKAGDDHFTAAQEPVILQNVLPAVRVFTKFPETIFGVTFMVVAPEHPLALQAAQNMKEVAVYIEQAGKKSELERTALDKGKSGVFTGFYCINQVNGAKVPIWVADYVIGSYGTGAVMGVPGSDLRDFDFAAKYDLPILRVIAAYEGDMSAIGGKEDVLEHGYIVNSGEFDRLKAPNPAKEKFMDYLEKEGFGQRKVNYHLHDWSISRQRYWGTPIPIIHCADCGDVAVPDKDLPVVLPEISNYAPEGKPPLATADEWVNVKCPNCGGDAKREVDTMDTFVDSSWYFLAYLNDKPNSKSEIRKISFATQNPKQIPNSKLQIQNKPQPWNPEYVRDWMPADLYVGGAEHTLGHTLYSRFFVKFLHDIGEVPFEEYAYKRVHHGVILGTDGARMSKSKGNVVNPDEQVAQFGADAVRMYLAFMGPYDLVAPWNPNGLRGVYHFLQRVWELGESSKFKVKSEKLSAEDMYWLHKTIKKVGDDIADTKYNTAVAALMEWLNWLGRKAHAESQRVKEPEESKGVTEEEYKTMLLLLAPFAPHMTEELYQQFFGNENFSFENPKSETKTFLSKIRNPKFSAIDSIHVQSWPAYDPKYIAQQTITIVVQVNGKVRDQLLVEASISQKDAEQLALNSAKVLKFLGKNSPQKIIFIPGKLVNLVV